MWLRALFQQDEIRPLVPMAGFHRNGPRRQRLQAPRTRTPRGLEGDVWEVWQRPGPRVSQRRPEEGPVPLLNLQQLPQVRP